MPLFDKISLEISKHGPISLARYMEICLTDRQFGYYMTRDPFGKKGDFVTAPEISQMFGELIGVWLCLTWKSMKKPNPFILSELGPGRGTLLADALRTASKTKGFISSCSLHLVEKSPILRKIQAKTIEKLGYDLTAAWWSELSDVPPGPIIVIANEFLDSLPIHQFVMTKVGWREKLIDIAGKEFAFSISQVPPKNFQLPDNMPKPLDNDVFEVSPAAIKCIEILGKRFRDDLGAALLVDYPREKNTYGTTLHAVHRHKHVSLFDKPGENDLTAHVDFGACLSKAAQAGSAIYGPITQGQFLNYLGISLRAASLLARATPAQAFDILAAKKRLTEENGMGKSFQVFSITSPNVPTPPGFEN